MKYLRIMYGTPGYIEQFYFRSYYFADLKKAKLRLESEARNFPQFKWWLEQFPTQDGPWTPLRPLSLFS